MGKRFMQKKRIVKIIVACIIVIIGIITIYPFLGISKCELEVMVEGKPVYLNDATTICKYKNKTISKGNINGFRFISWEKGFYQIKVKIPQQTKKGEPFNVKQEICSGYTQFNDNVSARLKIRINYIQVNGKWYVEETISVRSRIINYKDTKEYSLEKIQK
ncbi:MAG: hypothetical protein LBM02_07550 [Lachnospiraceae bacterium]|jgi:hypothetical protein|nr:hypothetical protein [Lachnospiraceae bacterium]